MDETKKVPRWHPTDEMLDGGLNRLDELGVTLRRKHLLSVYRVMVGAAPSVKSTQPESGE